MRFATADVSRAYSDYLDSLDDWPPPEETPPGAHLEAFPPQKTDSNDAPPMRVQEIHFN